MSGAPGGAEAWPALERLGAVMAGSDPGRLRFSARLPEALDGAQFVQESGPERDAKLLAVLEAVRPGPEGRGEGLEAHG